MYQVFNFCLQNDTTNQNFQKSMQFIRQTSFPTQIFKGVHLSIWTFNIQHKKKWWKQYNSKVIQNHLKILKQDYRIQLDNFVWV